MLTKDSLIRRVSETTDMNLSQAKTAVEAVFDHLETGLIGGQPVKIGSIGSLHAKQYDAYRIKNPRTGKPQEVPATVKVALNRSKKFQAQLNGHL